MVETVTIRRPNQVLAPFVESLWHYDVDLSKPGPDRLLPHGAFELVISLSGRPADALLAGPQTGFTIVDPAAFSPLVGAHFRPGGATALLGHAASEFVDRDVPLDAIWSRRARLLCEQLGESASPGAALRTIEAELTRYARNGAEMHPAVALAVSEFHGPRPSKPIRDLTRESGISHRRFIELFTGRIGLTPKRYARIQRFQRVLAHVCRSPSPDWCQLAYASGYADQAHMIREFRELSGMKPTDYIPRWPDHPNHVPLP